MLRDCFLQIGSDECLDDDTARRVFFVEHAAVEQRLRAVERDQRTDLVAGQQLHLAAGSTDRDTHSIAVRIGGDNEIRVLLFCQSNRECERLGVLRIG